MEKYFLNPTYKNHLFIIRNGLYEAIKKNAPKFTGNILDFGCGSKPYESLFTNCKSYIGVDFLGEGHTHENEKIEYFYDGKTLPFDKNSFDNIFSSEVFEHIFNLNEILPEINRVLMKDGFLFFTCPFVWPEHEAPNDYARYSQFALKDILAKFGFQVSSFQKSGNFKSTVFQLRILHFYEVVIPSLKYNFLKKIARQLLIPILNFYYNTIRNQKNCSNDSLYLNNIVIAQKIKELY